MKDIKFFIMIRKKKFKIIWVGKYIIQKNVIHKVFNLSSLIVQTRVFQNYITSLLLPWHWIYFGNHLHKRSPLNNLAGRTPLRYKQPTKDHGQKKRDSCANTAVVLITDPFVPKRTFSNPLHILRDARPSVLYLNFT